MSGFSAPGYAFGKEPNAFLKAQAHRLRAGQTALSVADGEGRNGVWLAEQGLDVLTIDFSSAALTKAQAPWRQSAACGCARKSPTLCAGVGRSPHSTWSWQSSSLSGPPSGRHFFAHLKGALKPGGVLLMQGYRPEQLTIRHRWPAHRGPHVYPALLEASFGDMAELEIREHDSVISEGSPMSACRR